MYIYIYIYMYIYIYVSKPKGGARRRQRRRPKNLPSPPSYPTHPGKNTPVRRPPHSDIGKIFLQIGHSGFPLYDSWQALDGVEGMPQGPLTHLANPFISDNF